MKVTRLLSFLAGFACACSTSGTTSTPTPTSPGKALITQMQNKTGTWSDLSKKKDVRYRYIYRNPEGKEDISEERYIFDSEASWAKYKKHEVFVMPNADGDVVQHYDGTKTIVSVGGKTVDDPKAVKSGDFLRKTNFYWFSMMQKLLDPGTLHKHEGTREVDGVPYDIVRVTFGESVGDAQDTYLLYVNPETKLVDQFLFTVMDFGMTKPMLMRVDYETFEGLMLPTKRKYAPSNWGRRGRRRCPMDFGDPWKTSVSPMASPPNRSATESSTQEPLLETPSHCAHFEEMCTTRPG